MSVNHVARGLARRLVLVTRVFVLLTTRAIRLSLFFRRGSRRCMALVAFAAVPLHAEEPRTVPELGLKLMPIPAGTFTMGSPADYGYMLWPIPGARGTIHEGAFEARGIFGQHIYVNPKENVVVVVWSAQPKPTGMSVVGDNNFFAAVAQAVR